MLVTTSNPWGGIMLVTTSNPWEGFMLVTTSNPWEGFMLVTTSNPWGGTMQPALCINLCDIHLQGSLTHGKDLFKSHKGVYKTLLSAVLCIKPPLFL